MTTIDGTNHPVQLHRALDDGKLRHNSRVAADVIHHGNTLMASSRGLAPTRTLCGLVHHGEQPGRIPQQTPPDFQRVLATQEGKLIQEALCEERVLRITHRAPERRRNPRVGFPPIDKDVRDGVFQRVDTLHRRAVYRTASSATKKRRAGDLGRQRHRPALCIHGTGKFHIRSRTIQVMLHIVFARPGELHGRSGHGLRHFHGLGNIVRTSTPPEAAAH